MATNRAHEMYDEWRSRMEPNIRAALDDIYRAKARLGATLNVVCPVGSMITWERGGRPACYGRVMMVGGDKLLVCNDRTKKEYWIAAAAVTNVLSKPRGFAEWAKQKEGK